MERRSFLSLGVSIALSGCLGEISEPQTRIDWIQFVNNRPEPYTIDVIIERDGEEVFSETYQLGTSPNSLTTRTDIPLRGKESYALHFLTDKQWIHIQPEDYDDVIENCIGIWFVLQQQGTIGYEIQPDTEC